MQDQEIVVYPNRTHILIRMVICGFMILSMLSFCIYVFVVRYKFEDIVFVTLYITMIILFLIFTVLIIRSGVRLLLMRTPLLIIDHEGITVGKHPGFQCCFIRWDEIEAIYTYKYIYSYFSNTYFCIRPKDTKQFLQRFNALERFMRHKNEKYGIAVASTLQDFMKMSADEIFQRLTTYYTYELNTYHIKLHR